MSLPKVEFLRPAALGRDIVPRARIEARRGDTYACIPKWVIA